jgi:hypothetical protein
LPYIPSQDYVRSLGDIAPAWRWVVLMPSLQGSLPINDQSGAGNSAAFPVAYTNGTVTLMPISTVPFGLVHRIELQPTQIASEARFYGGRIFKFPRHTDAPNVTITFYEDDDYSVFNYIKTWQNLVVDNNLNYGIAANYKFPISIFAFDVVNNTSPRLTTILDGCWPPNGPALSYNYEASGAVTLSVDFCVDKENSGFNRKS